MFMVSFNQLLLFEFLDSGFCILGRHRLGHKRELGDFRKLTRKVSEGFGLTIQPLTQIAVAIFL